MAGQTGGIGAGALAGLAAVVLALAGWGVWNAGVIPGLGPTAPESAGTTAEPEARPAVAEIKRAEAETTPALAEAKPEETKLDAPEAKPEPATPDAAEVKPEPETPALPAPAFDVVRVETDGTTLIAGSAAPGARVVFLLDGTEVGEAVAGTDGKFAAFLSLGEGAGPRVLTMMAEIAGAKLASEDQIILAPVVAEAATPAGDATVAQTSPEATAQPDTTVAEAKPEGSAAETKPETTVAEAKPEPTADEPKPEAKPEPIVAEVKPETTASENNPEATVTEVKPDTTVAEARPEPPVAEVKPEPMAPERTANATTSATAPVATDSGTNMQTTAAGSSSEPAVAEAKPEATVAEVRPEPTATETKPDPTAAESKPEPTVAEAKPEPTVTETKPDSTVADSTPEPTVAEAKPEPIVAEAKPETTPADTKPEPTVAEVKPETTAPDAKPEQTDAKPEPTVAEATPEPNTTEPQTKVAETKPEPARTTSPVPLLSDQTSAPQAPDASAESATPGSAPAPVQPPVATSVAVLRATKDGIEVIQPATPQRPEALDQIALEVISYSEEGEVQLAGRAGGQTTVRVYLDNKAVADIGTDDNGQWKGELSNVKPGIYTLRLDALNAGGEVVSRLETPFKRESPEVLNPPSRENMPDNAPVIRAVTVQKGDTLWAISRERYGNGILYVRVFEANKTSIRNPDLIYPGQVFSIP